MKKLILITILFGLMTAPVLAKPTLDGVSPHLGWWDPDHPRATHQYWDFTANVYSGGIYDYYASPPTEKDSPGTTMAFIQGTYDGQSSFSDPNLIKVLLEIENFQEPYEYKETWVQVGFSGLLVGPGVLGSGEEDEYPSELLGFTQEGGVATFGFIIWPNPSKEDIWFDIIPFQPAAGGLVTPVLDWIHVDTICIPAPGAVFLGGIGIALVGWLRRRRTL